MNDKPNLVARSMVATWHELNAERWPGVRIRCRTLDAFEMLDVMNSTILKNGNPVYTRAAARTIYRAIEDVEGIANLDRAQPIAEQMPSSIEFTSEVCNLIVDISTITDAEKN